MLFLNKHIRYVAKNPKITQNDEGYAHQNSHLHSKKNLECRKLCTQRKHISLGFVFGHYSLRHTTHWIWIQGITESTTRVTFAQKSKCNTQFSLNSQNNRWYDWIVSICIIRSK